MTSPDRMPRVNELLRETIAEIIAGELKDPRLDVAVLSVTEVRAARDLRTARAFISVMASPDGAEGDRASAPADAVGALQGAAPLVHRLMRRRLRMKRVPTVRFELDGRIGEAAELQERLRSLAPGDPGPGDPAAAGPAAPA